jgi:hypothetical protein
MVDDNNRHHHNNQQPPVVIEPVPYPQVPMMVGAPVAERGPDNYECSSGDALLIVRMHDSTCDA